MVVEVEEVKLFNVTNFSLLLLDSCYPVIISKTQSKHSGRPSEACYSDTTLEDMQIMLKDLELLNSECTEEGNQTNAECDVHVKEERDMFMEYLRIGISLLEEKEKNDAKYAAAEAAGSTRHLGQAFCAA